MQPTMKKNFDAIVIGSGQSGPFWLSGPAWAEGLTVYDAGRPKGESQGFMKVLVDADSKRDPGSNYPRYTRG
jgi:hypothetical protein